MFYKYKTWFFILGDPDEGADYNDDDDDENSDDDGLFISIYIFI